MFSQLIGDSPTQYPPQFSHPRPPQNITNCAFVNKMIPATLREVVRPMCHCSGQLRHDQAEPFCALLQAILALYPRYIRQSFKKEIQAYLGGTAILFTA